MSSTPFCLTLVVLFSAYSLCFAAGFKLEAADWIRRWEQQIHLTSHDNEAENKIRDDILDSMQCGYQACFLVAIMIPSVSRLQSMSLPK